jgi:hypothetical protein
MLLLSSSASARTIEGLVREAGTRAAVPGAILSAPNAEDAIADENGRFILVLPANVEGQVQVTIDVGGVREIQPITLRNDRSDTAVTLYVETQGSEQTRVRERRSKDNAARGAHRIDGTQVNEMPGTYGDPAKAIENFPGMGRVFLSQGALLIRGAGPADSNIFVDDYEIPDLYHYTGSTSVINIPFVESVELVPGAFSARYGRSTGGIVTLKTRKLPSDDVHGVAKLDIIDGGAYVGVPIKRDLVVGVSARRSWLDFLRNGQRLFTGTGDAVLQIPTYWDYQAKLDWDIVPGHEFTVFVFGSGDREDNVADGNGAIDAFQRSSESDFHRLSLRYQHGIAAGLQHSLTVVGGFERVSLDEQRRLRYRDRATYDLQVRDEWTWRTTSLLGSPAKVVMGFDGTARGDWLTYQGGFADNRLRSFPAVLIDSGTAASTQQQAWRTTGALYAEGTLEPWPGVVLVPGLRLDGALLDGPTGATPVLSIEPRMASSWQITSGSWGTQLRFGGGLSSRPPTPDELAAAKAYGFSLPSQRALSLQVGVEQSLSSWWTLSLTTFAAFRDQLTFKSRAFPIPDRLSASPVDGGGSGSSMGAEGLLRFIWPGVFWGWATYSLARHERYPGKTSDRAQRVELAPFDTTHLLGVVGQFQLPWGFRVGARYRVGSGTPEDAVQSGSFDADSGRYLPIFGPRGNRRFPVFQVLDVRVDWSTTFDWFVLTAYADLVNVLNQRAVEEQNYNFDFSQTNPRLGLPIIPAVGAKVTF